MAEPAPEPSVPPDSGAPPELVKPPGSSGPPGSLIELTAGPWGNGGISVCRQADGPVLFLTGALPGERVTAQITARAKSYWRAQTVSVLAPSPDRVEPPWPLGAQTGAADWLHVAPAAARAAKAQVLRDQLSHGAGLRPDFEVEPLGDGSPLGWRTKIELVVDQAGRAGMHRSTSHVFEPLTDMPLAVPAIRALDIFSRRWQPGSRLVAVAPSAGKAFCVDDAAAQCRRRREVVRLAGQVYHYELAASGFWQSLRLAPEMLVTAVLEALRPTSGQRIWELYAGAGLFTLPLAAAGARVSAVEGARQAVKDLRGNLRRAGLELEEIEHASAAKALRSGFGRSGRDGARSASPVAVLLDPPRAGAGRAVSEALIAAAPRRLVYLSCEPSTLARDLGFWTAAGYRLTGLRAFDLFPGTHHVEALATLTR